MADELIDIYDENMNHLGTAMEIASAPGGFVAPGFPLLDCQ